MIGAGKHGLCADINRELAIAQPADVQLVCLEVRDQIGIWVGFRVGVRQHRGVDPTRHWQQTVCPRGGDRARRRAERVLL
jgi:hypothetical protein